ncbi:ECF-type sigma factor [Stieleria varia]|uniref:ECF sigma factor n=1 Tax=Stieleria varia TaxID=2528005 RepID=A0A5C5ZYN1_9BACT|nr:ECF-type sigma factor [Stieleria varia]TWT92732.1 ECF sigma factor [Stieleria varia]
MNSDEEISMLIERIKSGRDDEASAALWENYFERLKAVAKRNLGGVSTRSSDEEDVALSAMHSFFRRAEGGGFEELSNRNELWSLLLTIVIRKAQAQRRRANAQKRGHDAVRGESVFNNIAGKAGAGLSGVAGDAGLASLLLEGTERLHQLDDPTLQRIAVLKLEGYTINEIADRLRLARSTVKRKIGLIKERWLESDE